MFRGVFEHTLNKQGRISLPSRFQRVLETRGCERLVMVFYDNRLEVYPEDEWERRESKDEALDEDDDNVFGYLRYRDANLVEIDVDKQGRINIPNRAIEEFGLSGGVTLLGARNKFEVYSKKQYEEAYGEWERSFRANKSKVSAKREHRRKGD